MATAVNEIIALGKKLEEAQAKLERADSVDRAIAESEDRLAVLRAAEKVVKTEVDANKERAHQLLEGAKVEAEAIRSAAYAEAGKARQAIESQYRKQVEGVEAHLAGQRESIQKAEARCAELEAEETRLAQSVTALKAELDALRARVLG